MAGERLRSIDSHTWDCAFAQELDQWLTLSVSRRPGESDLEHDVVELGCVRVFVERVTENERWRFLEMSERERSTS